MKPIIDEETGTHCSDECPFLDPYEHPFYHHSAWCWKQMKPLDWYDYWISDCIVNNPDEMLVKIRYAGNAVPIHIKEHMEHQK